MINKLNEDPLHPEFFMIGSNYTTESFKQGMYVPYDGEELKVLQAKNEGELKLMVNKANLENWIFQELNEHEYGYHADKEALFLQNYLKQYGLAFEWKDFYLDFLVMNGRYPNEWNEQERREYILKFELKKVEQHGQLRDLWHIRTEQFTSHVVDKLIKKQMVALWDNNEKLFVEEVEYYGSGRQYGPLSGHGGITWEYKETELHFHQTWIS